MPRGPHGTPVGGEGVTLVMRRSDWRSTGHPRGSLPLAFARAGYSCALPATILLTAIAAAGRGTAGAHAAVCGALLFAAAQLAVAPAQAAARHLTGPRLVVQIAAPLAAVSYVLALLQAWPAPYTALVVAAVAARTADAFLPELATRSYSGTRDPLHARGITRLRAAGTAGALLGLAAAGAVAGWRGIEAALMVPCGSTALAAGAILVHATRTGQLPACPTRPLLPQARQDLLRTGWRNVLVLGTLLGFAAMAGILRIRSVVLLAALATVLLPLRAVKRARAGGLLRSSVFVALVGCAVLWLQLLEVTAAEFPYRPWPLILPVLLGPAARLLVPPRRRPGPASVLACCALGTLCLAGGTGARPVAGACLALALALRCLGPVRGALASGRSPAAVCAVAYAGALAVPFAMATGAAGQEEGSGVLCGQTVLLILLAALARSASLRGRRRGRRPADLRAGRSRA
ncbi:hypothetical protein [Streptomyces fractus]|uniref:hypothetical protein n=1 Tax=Streptomyces fractus TaxID=641806 RepID=UPI003CF0FB9D